METQHSTLLRGTDTTGAGQGSQSDAGAPWIRQMRDAFGRALGHGTIFLPIIAAALWALAHPYRGIVGDASIYIGRALADLDPNGLGRDLLFAHDGQSKFSLYPLFVKQLVIAFGTDAASLSLVLSSIALWIAALVALARRFTGWQHVWIFVAFVALLPVNYGAPQRFGFSEIVAVPRPLAEALVLFALASFLGGRTRLTFGILFAATLVHPLMALAGWVAVWLALALEDRRWWIAAATGTVVLVIGAMLGLPVLDRLVEAMPPDLKALAASRSPLLFPTQWPPEFLGTIIAQMATIAIAANLYEGRRRRMLLAAMVTGIFGIAAQALFGDILSSLLVIQVQCWRMAWLTAAIGSFALTLCTLALWQRGASGRIVLALLVLLWLAASDLIATSSFAAIALTLHFAGNRFAALRSDLVVKLVWTITGLVGLFLNANYLVHYGMFLAGFPAQAGHGFSYFWSMRYFAFPTCIVVLALMLPQMRSRLLWTGRGIAALLLVVATVYFWDDRGFYQRIVDRQEQPREITAAIANRPGEILWIGGLGEPWYLTGRPQWASRQQAVASVFSHELALTWRDRMTFLRDERLVDLDVLNSVAIPSSDDLPRLSMAGVAHLCARPDAPAAIIAAVETGKAPFAGQTIGRWHLPQPMYFMTDDGSSYTWHGVTDFIVIACAAR